MRLVRSRLYITLLIALNGAGSAQTAPEASQIGDWQARYANGDRLLQEGRTEEALAELRPALAGAAGAAGRGVVLGALGQAEFQAGRYLEAKRHFEAAIPLWTAQSREWAAALSNAGVSYLALGEYAHAEEVFRQALEIVPDEPKLWQNLGQARFSMGQRREAEECLRTALSLASRLHAPSVASDLATLLEANHQYAKAAATLTEAIAQAGPGRDRARMQANLGVLLWRLNRRSESAAQLRAALAEMESAVGLHHPDIAKVLQDYREVLRKTGQKAEATAVAARAAAIRSSFARHAGDRRNSVDWRDLK